MELVYSWAKTLMEEAGVRTQVRLVDVFYPIRKNGIWHNKEIQLNDKLPFFGGIVFCIPVPEGSPLAFSMHLEQANISRSNVRFQRLGPILRMGDKGYIYQISSYGHTETTSHYAY